MVDLYCCERYHNSVRPQSKEIEGETEMCAYCDLINSYNSVMCVTVKCFEDKVLYTEENNEINKGCVT